MPFEGVGVKCVLKHFFCCIHVFLLVTKAFEGRRIRVRLSLGVEFDSQAAKSAFLSRLEYIRSLLTPPGLRSLDNHGLLSALFNLVSLPGVTRAPASHLPGSSCAPANLASTNLASTDRPAVVQSFNSIAYHSGMIRI